MKRVLMVSIVAFQMLCLGGCLLAAEGEDMLKPEDFAILAWGSTPGDAQVLKDIKACGFNLAGFVAPKDLDAVERAGLKTMVWEPTFDVRALGKGLDQTEIDRRVAAAVKSYGSHPALFGYYLMDEPSAGVFPALAQWAKSVAKSAPNSTAYINLFPNYASSDQLGTATYEEYLESFVTTVKPKYLSYDHYALMADGTLRGGYFQNLEAVRSAAIKHKMPFWNIVLANAHFHYAEPTPAGLRFQAYSTLAYGARGISYFTYFAPQIGNYRLAPIDQFGNKTPTWDMLRDVNLQLHKLGPTYTKLKSVNVFHHPNVPEGCLAIGSSKYVESLEGGDLLVGEFLGPDRRPYVIVVNKSLHNSTSFGIRFKQDGPVLKVSQYDGKTQPTGGEDWWLAPGQGVMLCVGKE